MADVMASEPHAAHPPREAGGHFHVLADIIEHAAHLLPTQGPITVFVHHNTLHALEHLRFDEAVKKGLSIYGAQPFMPEDYYRFEVASKRILPEDLAAVLIEDLGENADLLIGFMGTRFHLRLAMLEHPLRLGTDAELRWLVAETDTLRRFRPETPDDVRRRLADETRGWILEEYKSRATHATDRSDKHNGIAALIEQFGESNLERWSDRTWESFTVHALWRICHHGVHGVKRFADPGPTPVRHRDLLRMATGQDSDLLVNELLIRFCAAFLDQGVAPWPLPDRDAGFYRSFIALYRDARPIPLWMHGLPPELRRFEREGLGPLESIDESLRLLGVHESEREDFLTRTLLALPGWGGMLYQMETNAEWTVHPAPRGTIVEFTAIRLLLERLAISHIASEALPRAIALDALRSYLRNEIPHAPRVSVELRAFLIFQLAQVRGWSPRDLYLLPKSQWARLVEEIESFNDLERRRIYHQALERRYRNEALDAVLLHIERQGSKPGSAVKPRPLFQLITCIDDREESFRRHLEEIAPECETLSAAGFFAVAMYYRGASEAHYRPLCPIVIKPQHWIIEQAAYSLTASSRQRAETRRFLGTATRRWHDSSRTFLGGFLTTLFGSLASIPMIMRILFPRLTAQLRRRFGSFVQPPPVTELLLLRTADPPADEPDHVGYSYPEIFAIVERTLRDLGLTKNFSRLVIVAGHGSGSLNNPHESAYNCGACSGGRGGPNARALAQMANDPRVRAELVRHGLVIPEDTHFVGAFHNTCDEDMMYFDLDRLPMSHRREFEEARRLIDQARERDAHERCRRFESALLDLSPRAALEHVETRAEDLSQVRPEYNHATNALCYVGRREWSRGLFLDRRAFLNSYDPTQDDEQTTILARILAAAIPVCAGISLEYYFSRVDVLGYGCGSKLPHNITSLLGVMEGAASDLRTGLSQQMVEIHDPLRILFLIETTPAKMLSIMERNPIIARLVRNEWVQLATLDPDDQTIHMFHHGQFVPYRRESDHLPAIPSSIDWYRGKRGNLAFASIDPEVTPAQAGQVEDAE